MGAGMATNGMTPVKQVCLTFKMDVNVMLASSRLVCCRHLGRLTIVLPDNTLAQRTVGTRENLEFLQNPTRRTEPPNDVCLRTPDS